MRIIAVKTLREMWKRYPKAKQALLSWYEEVDQSNWSNPNELKKHYKNASILSDKRVVFNVNGNNHRLIVDVEYRLKIVFVVWFGSHFEYDKIDAKRVSYDKTD